MRQKVEQHHRRAKLPPILEIDEDGLPVNEMEMWSRPRWSSDDDEPAVQMGEWDQED